jgi:hypothetical protein
MVRRLLAADLVLALTQGRCGDYVDALVGFDIGAAGIAAAIRQVGRCSIFD